MENQPYIRVFTKNDCPFCVQAKQLLTNKGFSYSEFVLGEDIDKEDFLSHFPDVKTVPYIIVGNNHVGGYKQLVEFFGEDL
jgi:glutaredoxin 3